MINLSLREEFRGQRLQGTAIELSNDNNTGATQVTAQQFLDITYPTQDLLVAIDGVSPDKGRPIAIIGERGLGKSHLMAALYHAVNDPAATQVWLNGWAATLNNPEIAKIKLRDEKMLVIGESLHRQRYGSLWDILFDKHPHGSYIKGKFESSAHDTPVPSDALILEMLSHTPVVLLLDEFQTWFDSLIDTPEMPRKKWAFNFIQILSEIANKHSDKLVLVISVRNGSSDAYQQVHRVEPLAVDFKAGGNQERKQQDRRRMLLHRLFGNRLQIPAHEIESLIGFHIGEYFRIFDIPSIDQEKKRSDFFECWPFSPHLLQLLEDQVLVATDAQETRDMIRILANLYKSSGEHDPILTAADFKLDDEGSGIGSLLDSVANVHHRELRERALRNIQAVKESVKNHQQLLPRLDAIMSSLWLRSIAVDNMAGAEPRVLQLDVTNSQAIDDNAFQVELDTICENSFNIHRVGQRLLFREEENPQAKLLASARNDKLFADGSDKAYLAREIRYVMGGAEGVAGKFRVSALPLDWRNDPWSALEENERPEKWDDRLPVLILPELPTDVHAELGAWVKNKLQTRRNTIRFVLPRNGSSNVYLDRDLLVLARAAMKAKEWSEESADYRKLHGTFQGQLRDLIKRRFDRFAILQTWNNQNPAQCVFSIETISAEGASIPEAIEVAIQRDLFEQEDFETFVLEFSATSGSMGKLLDELREPRATGRCIPWLGEAPMKERLLRICARGKIAINNRGMTNLQVQPGEDDKTAFNRMKQQFAVTGRQLYEVHLLLPSAVPTTGGAIQVPEPVSTDAGLLGGFTEGQIPTGVNPQPVTPLQGGSGNTGSGAGSTETSPLPGGSIFGGTETTGSGGLPPIVSQPAVTQCTAPATAPINLLGKLENWGIQPATNVSNVTLKVAVANGAQLKDLLRKLPDGWTYELTLDKEA